MSRKTLAAMLAASALFLWAGAVAADDRDDRGRDRETVGAVTTMTNSATGNEVVVFNRDDEGILTKADSVPTGGNGLGGRWIRWALRDRSCSARTTAGRLP
jgi:hypothetical protein